MPWCSPTTPAGLVGRVLESGPVELHGGGVIGGAVGELDVRSQLEVPHHTVGRCQGVSHLWLDLAVGGVAVDQLAVDRDRGRSVGTGGGGEHDRVVAERIGTLQEGDGATDL